MKISTVAGALMVGAMNLPLMAHAADDNGLGVQLYGVVDAGIAVTHISGTGDDKGSKTGMIGGGLTDSLWGLKGGEDLGDGWRANFKLESGFDPSNGDTSDEFLFGYNAWVGLANKAFGELRLGRQDMAGKAYGSELELGSWKDMGMGALFKASDNYQFSNVISYYTPSYDGFQAGISYSFDADNKGKFKTASNNRAFSLGMKYENGPLLAVATWDQMRLGNSLFTFDTNPVDGTPVDAGKPQALQIGATYDFEVVKVSAAWSRQRNGYVGLNGGEDVTFWTSSPRTGSNRIDGLGPLAFVQDGTVDAYLLGVSVPVGQGAIIAQWSLARPNWDVENDAGELVRKNAQVMTLGYTYDMSPRTTLYAFGGYGSNYTTDGPFDADNSHMSRFGMGISHSF